MWFKNVHVFRFTKPFEVDEDTLQEKLEANAFQPCSSQELSRYGWVPPLGRQGVQYAHYTNGYIMLCSQRQDKLLPSSVINEELEERVELIREKDGRAVGRKERQDLKDEITFELLPKAFTRSTRQFAYIAPREGWIVINSGSANRSEDMLSYLRDTLGTLPVIPLTPTTMPQDRMTHWLKERCAPDGFEFGGECVLKDMQNEGAQITCKQLDLQSEELHGYVQQGMLASRLSLAWQERVECLVDDKLMIKRLRFSDVVQEKSNDVDAQDGAEKFDVDFAIMSLELTAFINALIEAFGGEDLSKLENPGSNSAELVSASSDQLSESAAVQSEMDVEPVA